MQQAKTRRESKTNKITKDSCEGRKDCAYPSLFTAGCTASSLVLVS